MAKNIEVSVVMPCLNEEATVGICVKNALEALEHLGLSGEIIVSDNGSTDRSVEIARSCGARVVHQPQRGYGNAYLKGLAEARGKYIVIGDSDGTYDFCELEPFLEPLRNGYDLVMGNRFKGQIQKGAMPWLHRYIGNPLLSSILNLFFHTTVADAHCGMRSFTREAYHKMRLQATGMEFASEMVIKAAKAGLKIAEVPITYYPRQGRSKLNSFRDGWRHLKFMLLYSPTHLFILPGFFFFLLGLVMLIALLPGPLWIGGRGYDMHAMVLGSLLAILGFQVVNIGLYAKSYAAREGFEEKDALLRFLQARFSAERGLLLGGFLFLLGLAVNIYVVYAWYQTGFQALAQVRPALLALTFMVIGAQMGFSSLFLSMLGLGEDGQG